MHVVPMRHRGRPCPQHQIRAAVPLAGNLFILERPDAVWRRSVRVASLLAGDSKAARALLPELLAVELVAMAQGGFTLAGVERLADGTEFAQSWWCRPAG